MPDERRYPWGGRKDEAEKVLEAFPKLKAICGSVTANANMDKWLKTRGVQGF